LNELYSPISTWCKIAIKLKWGNKKDAIRNHSCACSISNCLYQFYPKKVHMMLALMFDPRFKDLFILDLFILSRHARIEKITITTRRYNFEIWIPLLCLAYQKVYPFAKHLSNSSPQELTLVMFGARLTHDQQITMKHISFLDFQITCKFLIFAIIDSNIRYLGQMCIQTLL
jgi:hypothetical protein